MLKVLLHRALLGSTNNGLAVPLGKIDRQLDVEPDRADHASRRFDLQAHRGRAGAWVLWAHVSFLAAMTPVALMVFKPALPGPG